MLRKFAVMASIAALAATGAIADGEEDDEIVDHTVMIMDFNFFPVVSYIDNGDRVEFINETDAPREIHARKALNRWSTGVLQPGESFEMVVTSGSQLYFIDVADETIAGNFSFEPAPLD
jgi:plastocyanin